MGKYVKKVMLFSIFLYPNPLAHSNFPLLITAMLIPGVLKYDILSILAGLGIGGLALAGLTRYEGQLLVKCELSRGELPKILECQFQHVFYF